MGIKALYKSKAFEPGSELWVCAGVENCDFTKEINWYSNFLLSRSLHHIMPALPSKLSDLLDEHELQTLKPSKTSQHSCLLESSRYFPNRYLLIEKFDSDLDKWIQKSLKVWTDLQKPSIRYFLPPTISNEDFVKSWPKTNYMMDISVVVS